MATITPERVSSTSTVYVHVPISATDRDTGQAVALGDLDVELAFVSGSSSAKPSEVDWLAAQWNDAATEARVLIGPQNSGHVLAAGTWMVWWRVHDLPEEPEDQAGLLVIY